MLVRKFRSLGSEIAMPLGGRIYTGAEIADEIERMTDVGKSVVAAAGIVLQAKATTPEIP